ncbi:MAG: GDP-mannose 4,6-dehydratase [Legionellaceae bacterium]|nr:GDP-mannose 4,6-dehydratase [Legionellaceae bacterium]
MHILVTGGAGFIGSHIVEHHLNCNNTVHVIDDLSTGHINNIKPFLSNPNFHFTESDLLTYPEIEKTVCWADRIYHMAAIVGVFRVLKEPDRVLAVNIGGTERLLRAIKSANWKPRLLCASTSEVYGDENTMNLSETIDLIISSNESNRSAYAISKIAAESFGMAYYRRFALPITILRFFNTIGPRQTGEYGMVVPRFVKQAVLNEPVVIYGSGEQVRSFIDVRDSIAFIEQIAENPLTIGQTINVGNDHAITINELARNVIHLSKSQSEVKHISYKEAYGEEFDDFMFRKPDLTKLHELTTYEYQWSLKKTVSDLIKREKFLTS